MAMAETAIDYELEYNNRKRVPEHAGISALWPAEAEAYRQTANAEYDIPYGDSDRSRYDLFIPDGATDCASLIVYIHGGYWQSRDRKDFSHVARHFNANGVSVAIPSYNLCPAVQINDIVEEIRMFLRALWMRTNTRPVIAGHSAGGHLTAAMVATDWSSFDDVPADLVTAGYAISGVFDLLPICNVSINSVLRLDETSAEAVSPLHWTFPTAGKSLVAAVGALESDEFIKQSRAITEIWTRKGVPTAFSLIGDANHFTIVNMLTKAESPMMRKICDMAAKASAGR